MYEWYCYDLRILHIQRYIKLDFKAADQLNYFLKIFETLETYLELCVFVEFYVLCIIKPKSYM